MALMRVEFVDCSEVGFSPEGRGWDMFMERQRGVLEEYGRQGWTLASAVPVQVSDYLNGVLLYFVTNQPP